ncbi:UNVERIFIED_CONTAM: hypothetical protein FKN15_030620 [Acipenser sinensis]
MKRLNSEPSLAKPSPPQAAQKNVFSKGQFRGSIPLLTEPTKADENEKEVFSKKACENSVSSRPGSGSDSIGSPSRTSSRPSSSESTGARNRTEYKSIDECEELVINAAATINNLSFYPVRNSVVRAQQLHLAELLVKLLLSNNMEGILEAARVFGNLSQSKEVRDFIVQKNVYKFMVALLDAKNQDVCFSACGVLINLTVDKNKRVILREEGGIKKLIDCLRDFGPTDWQLASLVCKTLWNYSEKMTCAALSFGEEETKALLHILSTYLVLVKLLLSNNMEGILEAARVFGNLSQSKEVRDFIVQKNVYKFMVALLDAKNQDVCFSACGVLINLTVDKNKRVILREEGGIKKLIDCLRDFGPTDWQLASLVCKTLWNYSEKMTCAALSFGEEETKALLHILSTYLGMNALCCLFHAFFNMGKQSQSVCFFCCFFFCFF